MEPRVHFHPYVRRFEYHLLKAFNKVVPHPGICRKSPQEHRNIMRNCELKTRINFYKGLVDAVLHLSGLYAEGIFIYHRADLIKVFNHFKDEINENFGDYFLRAQSIEQLMVKASIYNIKLMGLIDTQYA